MSTVTQKVDSVFRTRSLGTAASGKIATQLFQNIVKTKYFPQGLSDQYSDGKAAKVWQLYIGESSERTDRYKAFMGNLLRENNCTSILDAACGTG